MAGEGINFGLNVLDVIYGMAFKSFQTRNRQFQFEYMAILACANPQFKN